MRKKNSLANIDEKSVHLGSLLSFNVLNAEKVSYTFANR